MSQLRRVFSPDHRPIYCVHPDEVRAVEGQTEVYLRHGIALERGHVVFDVGANVGLFALEAARRGALVHAFEPLPATFAALQANAREFGEKQIHAHNLALGAARAQANFAYFARVSALSTRFPELVARNASVGVAAVLDDARLAPRFGWFRRSPEFVRRAVVALAMKWALSPRSVSCRVETFSDARRALGIERVDLLKIDVEGAESEVLAGIGGADWKRIAQVVMEIHDENGRLKQIEMLLRERGFDVVSEPEPQAGALGVWLLWARRG